MPKQQQQPASRGAAPPATSVAPPPSGTSAPLDGPAKVTFLLDVAARLESEGNPVEAVKSLETALLLRRSLDDRMQPLFPHTLAKQAQSLIMKCNALGVDSFQSNDYDSAEFFLDKALFLTDDATATNCFDAQEHDRLRLRAATFNNFGCLERRRGRLKEALTFLQRAVEVEAIVDPDLGASASTNLNLCTVLNKLGQHEQAVVAAERSVRALRVQAQSGSDDKSRHFVEMTLSAYYNLGLSCEFTGKPKDTLKAADAYSNCIVAGNKLAGLTPAENPVLQAAERALIRLGQPVPLQARPLAIAPRPANSADGMRPIGGGELIDSSLTPRPVPPMSRGLPALRPNTTNPRARIETGISAHTARIKAKQVRKEEAAKRSELALQRAQLAHDREKAEKLRKEQERAAKERAEMAKQLYHEMEAGMRADRMRHLNDMATRIQARWRGYLYRDYLADRLQAAIRIQAVARSRICRNHLREEANAAATRARLAAKAHRENEAARTIQKAARTMIRRLQSILNWKLKIFKRQRSARIIQRAYAAYRNRIQQRIYARVEAERLAEERRFERLNQSARKIQRAYRTFKSRRFMRIVRMQQIRRNAAATKIQALVRGTLTRAWFRHYRVRRREQELSTAANLRLIAMIQRAWRVAVAKRVRHRLYLEKHVKARQIVLNTAARKIQCAWRCFTARRIASGRRRVVTIRTNAARHIQSWFKMTQQRKRYIWRRDEARKLASLKKIQRWCRGELARKKEKETAQYHAELLRREKVKLVRTKGAIVVQTVGRHILSSQLVESVRADFLRRTRWVLAMQRVSRGFHARKDMFALRRVAFLVDERAKLRAKQNKAASKIQRAVRSYQAKDYVENLRVRKAAAIRVQSGVRMLLAKCKLRRLQKQKRDRARDVAARKIQRSIRLYFKRQELKRLEEYYNRRRHQKLLEQRRIEASISIQAHWRGYATRQATLAARQELMQQTVDAIRIQRAFRSHLFRVRLAAEFLRRKRLRNRHKDAAIKIQCFWRRILAMDYVALLRERKFNRTVAAIVIQCAWRCVKAREERDRRRQVRTSVRQLSAAKHDQWVHSCDRINACLKSIMATKRNVHRVETELKAEVERRFRAKLAYRHRCATKIQAVYRGHYERCYARGVRREAREREAVLKRERDRRQRAALRIQCAFRSHLARERTQSLRANKHLEALSERLAREERAEPKNVIKQLFWAHEAAMHKNFTAERRARAARQDAAAINIQRIARGFLATRRVRKLLRERKENAAAVDIQEEWRRHRERKEESRTTSEKRAATAIQAVVRMFLVMRRYRRSFDTLKAKKHQGALLEEKQDAAATSIQAAWRGTLARQRCERLRYQVQKDQRDKVQFEAARLIQKNWRRWLAQRRVLKIRCERDGVPLPPSRKAAAARAPKPPPKRASAGFRRTGQ